MSRASNLQPRVLGRVFVLALLWTTASIASGALSCERDGLGAVLIPGTERIERRGSSAWFTISPDERWLTFMEVDSAYWSPEIPTKFHFVSIELQTGLKTHHDLDGIPQSLFSVTMGDPWWDVHLWWKEVAWYDGRLYVEMAKNRTRPTWIAFAPDVISPKVVERPPSLSCSGCSPPKELMEYAKARGLDKNDFPTSAYRNGEFSRMVYAERYLSSKEAIVERVEPDGSGTRVFEERRNLRNVASGNLLISPDDRYLAIVLEAYLRSPIPLPTRTEELIILDLQSGKESMVKRTLSIGNLMWSADSKRLYFAAANSANADGIGDGVYVVSVPQ
jgi:hypothetical protein